MEPNDPNWEDGETKTLKTPPSPCCQAEVRVSDIGPRCWKCEQPLTLFVTIDRAPGEEPSINPVWETGKS